MKRITFADVPVEVLTGEPLGVAAKVGFMVKSAYWQVVDVHRDPRTGIAITVVVDGPTGRTWLANPDTNARRT